MYDIGYIKQLNRHLLETYGSDHTSRPRYRVMWSEDLLEKRNFVLGMNEDGSENVEVREVKKYSWVKDRYIFQKHFVGPAEQQDIKNWDGYEALFTFDTNGGLGEALIPTQQACEFIIMCVERTIPMTPKEKRDFYEEQERKQIERDKLELAEAGRLRLEDSVGYTGKEFNDVSNSD